MITLSDVTVVVNNEPIAIVPNSVSFSEGFGEQNMRAASSGGGVTEQVYSENVETNFSMLKFEMYPDIDSIESVRSWKSNKNRNVFSISGSTPDGKSLTRTFNKAAILGDYEVNLGSDTTFEVDVQSNSAV